MTRPAIRHAPTYRQRCIVALLTRLCIGVTFAMPVAAEELAVRSGAHNGFSRIVIAPAQKTGWQLGRVGAGYELRLDRKGISFDFTRAFDLISKQHLSALSDGTTESSMAFGLACDCHAVGFETAGGAIVVDIAAGPANSGSGFEAQLDAAPDHSAATIQIAQSDHDTAPATSTSAQHFPFSPDPGHARNPGANPGPFWAGLSAPTAPEQHTDAAEGPVSKSVAGNAPDLRISNTEQALLFQLGRAAAQGLVTPTDRAAPLSDNAQSPADQRVDQAATTAEPAEPAPEMAPLQSETSIDRDLTHLRTSGESLTPDGARCTPDDQVAVAEWGDETDPADQMVRARAALVGEFDTPDAAAVVGLARLYVHFGFGAEARATLDAFAVADTDLTALRDLTFVVDGDAPPEASPMRGQTGCESDIALWSMLANGTTDGADKTRHGPVLRAFAALPPALRMALGPRLADIFLAAGDADAARTVRDATDRAATTPERAIHLIDARIDLSNGDVTTAQSLLDRLSTGNDATATEALVLGIETRLSQAMPVEPILAEAAEALAHENRGTPLGGRLARAHALALAANGAFDAAFSALAAAEDIPEDARRTAGHAIFRHLADTAPETDFLAQMASQIPRFLTDDPDAELQLTVADRLVAAGLPALSDAALSEATRKTDAGRLVLARTALANFAPQVALDVLADLDSADAIPLRARAYALLGNNAAAADAYAAAGQSGDGASAAMRAGDWTRAAALGDDNLRGHLRDLDLVPPPSSEAPQQGTAAASAAGSPSDADPGTSNAVTQAGPITAAKGLLEHSRATRAAVESLLSSLE